MAVTSDAWSYSDLAAMIPEVWTPVILEELFAKTVFANFFTDLSSYAQGGGDIFHIPEVYTNSFTVQTQSTQGAEITTESVAQGDVTLTISLHKYIAHLIGDKDQAQLKADYDFNGIYARKIGATLADALEDSLAALWSGLSTNTVGDTATVLTDLEIRQAIQALDTANYDLTECAWFIHPEVYWSQIAGIQKYYDASMTGQTGGNSGFTRTGNFGEMNAARGLKGTLYGIPVYVSSNVVNGLQTYRNILAHKSAFGFAIQTPGGSKVRVQAKNRPENLGLLTVTDILYGVAELRDSAAVLVNANDAATTS